MSVNTHILTHTHVYMYNKIIKINPKNLNSIMTVYVGHHVSQHKMTILINTMITYYCVHTYLSSVTSQENTFVNICSRGCIPRKHRKINVVNYIFHILDSSAYSKQQMHFKIIFVIVNMTIVMCYFSLNFLFII